MVEIGMELEESLGVEMLEVETLDSIGTLNSLADYLIANSRDPSAFVAFLDKWGVQPPPGIDTCP